MVGSVPTGTKLRNNLAQIVHSYVSLPPNCITKYWSKDGSSAEKVTARLTKSNGSHLLGNDLKGHLRADLLYTMVSSGPSAQQRVWENFTISDYAPADIICGHANAIGQPCTLRHADLLKKKLYTPKPRPAQTGCLAAGL